MKSISTQEKAQSLKYRMRWWTLLVLSVSLLILIVDDTIVNVAIPTLQRELGATASALQWIVASYILVFAGLLLTMGSLGDRFGRKRMLQARPGDFRACQCLRRLCPVERAADLGAGRDGIGRSADHVLDPLDHRERVPS